MISGKFRQHLPVIKRFVAKSLVSCHGRILTILPKEASSMGELDQNDGQMTSWEL